MTAIDRSTSEIRPTFADGYEMHPIQLRAALATPGKWRDALVARVSEDGLIELVDPFEGSITRLWNHSDNRQYLRAGSPVSWHPVYGVLGCGAHYLSVVNLAD
jgi:hypothetical protein